MNMKNYYEKQEADIRARWFPEHKATFQTVEGGSPSLTWKRPNTSNYWCRYIIEGGTLIVYGDIGEAVHRWHDALGWAWLADMNLDYFAGKCCASETGRQSKEWDEEVAKGELAEHFEEFPEDRLKWDEADQAETATSSLMDWCMFLREYGYEVFGDGYTEMGDIGEVTSMRCQAHLIGIKMAIAQLNPVPA